MNVAKSWFSALELVRDRFRKIWTLLISHASPEVISLKLSADPEVFMKCISSLLSMSNSILLWRNFLRCKAVAP